VTAHAIPIVPKRDDAPAIAPGLLAHLSDIDDDYMIADPTPDVREWRVALPDGRRVGRVDDVVVDTSTMTAKYLEVKLDPEVMLGEEDRWVLVPVESVQVDTAAPRVVVDRLPVGELADMPRHGHRVPTVEEQRALLTYFEIAPPGT
jgi:sporulation protein YlmC with PRC-barrel domain